MISNIDRDRELSLYLIECMNKPFKWGEHDCCIFAVRWLEKLSGNKYLPDEIKWNDALSAARYIKNHYGNLEDELNKQLKSVQPALANDGDFTIVDGTMYIFSGRYIVSVGYNGLECVNRQKATKAWSYQNTKST